MLTATQSNTLPLSLNESGAVKVYTTLSPAAVTSSWPSRKMVTLAIEITSVGMAEQVMGSSVVLTLWCTVPVGKVMRGKAGGGTVIMTKEGEKEGDKRMY